MIGVYCIISENKVEVHRTDLSHYDFKTEREYANIIWAAYKWVRQYPGDGIDRVIKVIVPEIPFRQYPRRVWFEIKYEQKQKVTTVN